MAESSLAVADYLLGQYDNFLQFAGQKDGATRCAQIVQLLLANHVDHAVSDPLVAVQLDASNAFCSVSRQPQFDVLAGKASRSYDDGRVQVGDELPTREITRVILCRLIYIVMSFKPFNDIIMIVCKFLIGLCCLRSYSI